MPTLMMIMVMVMVAMMILMILMMVMMMILVRCIQRGGKKRWRPGVPIRQEVEDGRGPSHVSANTKMSKSKQKGKIVFGICEILM